VIEALGELGYQVISADRGAFALEVLRSRGDIALLLTDVVMPGMDGPTLAEQARLLRQGLKVVYMTGYDRSAIVQNGTLAPGAHLVSKPFTIGQLGAALDLALRGDEAR
jgi:CheY-like chemotaxis protein